MNIETGELFKDYDEAVMDSLKRELTPPEDYVMPLEEVEYKELKNMNRAQRRQWAREHGEFKNRTLTRGKKS